MYSNIEDAWNNDPIQEMTTKYTHKRADGDNSLEKIFKFKDNNDTISEQSAISLSKLNTNANSINESDSLFINSNNNSENKYNSKCLYSVKHLKKCTRCTNKLNKIIDTKMQDKLDRIILDMKMSTIQNKDVNVKKESSILNNSGRELVIIFISIILAIILIFLIIKSI